MAMTTKADAEPIWESATKDIPTHKLAHIFTRHFDGDWTGSTKRSMKAQWRSTTLGKRRKLADDIAKIPRVTAADRKAAREERDLVKQAKRWKNFIMFNEEDDDGNDNAEALVARLHAKAIPLRILNRVLEIFLTDEARARDKMRAALRDAEDAGRYRTIAMCAVINAMHCPAENKD